MPAKAKLPVPYPYISRVDAARFLCVSVQQIDKYIFCGTLHPLHVGRKIIFRRAELEHLAETDALPVMPRLRPQSEVKR
jgi:hypothetical protein